jgi:hypothetical protein
VVYALVALLFVAGALAQPTWGLVEPGVKMRSLFLPADGSPRRLDGLPDPWGRPIVLPAWAEADAPEWPYSLGPNGVDERGKGDDVVLSPRGLRDDLYDGLPALLFLACVGLAGGWELLRWVRRSLRRPRAELPSEVGLAAGLSAPVGLLVGLGVGKASLLWGGAGAASSQQLIVVPLPYAAGGTAFLVSLGFLLWLRLRRAGDEGSAPPAG